MLKIIISTFVFMVIFVPQMALAYDRADYATTEAATFDALVKANDEFINSGPSHQSALESYRGAVLEYSSSIKIKSPSGDAKEVNILKQR